MAMSDDVRTCMSYYHQAMPLHTKKRHGAFIKKNKVLVTKNRAHFLVTQIVFPPQAGPISGPENTLTGVSRNQKKYQPVTATQPRLEIVLEC